MNLPELLPQPVTRIVAKSGLALMMLGTVGATASYASVILSKTRNYAFGGDPTAIVIKVDVFDNYMGDFKKYLWQYTVTNNSFDPNPGISNGFSGFETALPAAVPDLGNVFAPTAAWDIDCCSGQPVEWDIRNSEGLGVMPGQTGVFGFTSLPRHFTNSNGWFHTWQFNRQTDIVLYSDGFSPAGFSLASDEPGPEVPDVLRDPINTPEPSAVVGLGLLLGFGALSRKRKNP